MAEPRVLADITSPRERLRYFHEFVNQLSPQERLTVSLIISDKNDHFSKLPVELIGQILRYLPLFHPWTTLSLVCNNWRRVLSDEILCSHLSHYRDTHLSKDSAFLRSNHKDVKAKIRHMQAQRLGRPFSFSDYVDTTKTGEGPLISQASRTVALSGSRIAYINHANKQDNVVVRDVVSGARHSLQGQAREKLMCLSLSSKILAFVSFSAKLYICKLSALEQSPKALRLPSADIAAFSADESAVVVALRVADGYYTVVLYDHDTGRSKSFDFSASQNSYTLDSILIDSKRRHVDFFSRVRQKAGTSAPGRIEKENLLVDHIRVAFDGTKMTASSPVSFPCHRMGYLYKLGDLHPTGRQGHYIFRNDRPDALRDLVYEDIEISFLCFDANRARVYEHVVAHCPLEDGKFPCGDPAAFSSLALWKDTEYKIVDNAHASGAWLLTSTEREDEASWAKKGRYRYRHAFRIEDILGIHAWIDKAIHPTILINDSFLVLFEQMDQISKPEQERHITVLCFEEGLQIANGEPLPLWEIDEDGKPTWEFSYEKGEVHRLPFEKKRILRAATTEYREPPPEIDFGEFYLEMSSGSGL